MRNYSKILKLASKNNGIILTKDAVENNIPKPYLRYALEDDVLEKIRPGTYITKETIEDTEYLLQINYKNLIFSYETSAFYNHLTTRDPLSLSITTISGNNVSSIKCNYDLDFHFVKKNKFELGIIEVNSIFGNKIKIYNKERTICDLLSKKYKGDKYIAIESLKTYLLMEDRDIQKLSEYAEILGVKEELHKKLEVLLWKLQNNY